MREHAHYFLPYRGEPENRGPFGGEGGIRTPETLSSLHAFQACALNRARPPLRSERDYASLTSAGPVREFQWRLKMHRAAFARSFYPPLFVSSSDHGRPGLRKSGISFAQS